MPLLRAEVIWAREATRFAVTLVVETSAQEAVATWDSATARVKDTEDRAALTERETQERVLRVEAESTAVLASALDETEGLVWKITLLEGELAKVCRAREVAEETTCGLFDTMADAERRREESERGHQEHLGELTLLLTRGSELCIAIVDPPWVKNHLSEGMQIATLHHIEMAGELAALQMVLSSTIEFTLGCLPDETFWVEVMDELVAEFQS
jgi:hypothetical protein